MKRHDTLQRHLKSNTIIYTKSAFTPTFSTFQYSITETTAGRGFLSQRKKWDMVRDNLKTRKEVQQQRQHTYYLWAAKRSQHYFQALCFPWNQLPAVLLILSTVVRRHIPLSFSVFQSQQHGLQISLQKHRMCFPLYSTEISQSIWKLFTSYKFEMLLDFCPGQRTSENLNKE